MVLITLAGIFILKVGTVTFLPFKHTSKVSLYPLDPWACHWLENPSASNLNATSFGYLGSNRPETARFVMVDQARSFRQRGLPMAEMMLGTNFFGYQHERVHANLKKIFHGPLLPEALERSIPMVENIAIDILKHWNGKTINTLEESKKYVLKVVMEFVIGATPEHEKEELTHACEQLISGVSSLQICVPGTRHWKAIKESRKKACALLDKIMSFRRVANDERRSGSRSSSSSSSPSSDDMLGLMMRLEDENGVRMSGEEIHDNILTILYAAYDSSASVLCWIIKVLTERPNLLASIKEEHEMINAEKGSDENIRWYDIKEQMQLSVKGWLFPRVGVS